MAAAPVPPSAIPPSSPASPSPPSLSPPLTASPPPASQTNANADPPPPNPSPPVASSPPPALSPPPVPKSPPPTSPPPAASPPPPVTPSPPPTTASPPKPSTTPVTPVASPPPPSANPPSSSPPPPPTQSPPPPVIVASPPVGSPPPPSVAAPPPTPAKPSPTPPSSARPPSSPPKVKSPPPEPQPSPPSNQSPPPPPPPPAKNQTRPVPSEPTPATPSPPTPPDSPPSNPTPPLTPSGPVPSAPTPATPSPSPPTPPDSPPSNPTPSLIPSGPPAPSTSSPPVLSPPVPLDTPVPPGTPSPTATKTSNSTPGVSLPGNINSGGGGGIKTGAAVGIAVVVSFVVLGLIGIVLWSVRKRKKQGGSYGHVMPSPIQSSQMSAESSYSRSPTPLVKTSSGSHGFPYSPSDPGLGHSKSWFTYEELSEATNGFSAQNLLGEGGFGCVYKGCLPGGREVAVKQLKDGGGQGEREFKAEVETISRVHHRHLVSLVGYCIWESQRLLVYDYVPNNTLYYHLHGHGRPVMDWATRVKVVSGAARGLAYLHEDCHPRIIHRDIKSSNILLDNNFEAQVSDFGLAKLAMDAYTHVTTRVMGTFGYLAPEYASSGKLTDRSDVFSFGVVLLELITGRKPVDSSQPLGDESLVEWARPLMARALDSRDFEELSDPRLEKNYNESEMFRMIEVAAACVRHSATMRPRMGQVVRALDGLDDSMDIDNGVRPGQSELFNSAQQSAEIRLFQRMAFGSQNYSSDFSQTGWNSQREL